MLTCCVSKLVEEKTFFWSVKAQQYGIENATTIPFLCSHFSKVIKVGNRMPVMLSYGSDYSPNLYATIVHKNVTVEEFASLLPLLSFPKCCIIFLIFISQEKFQTS